MKTKITLLLMLFVAISLKAQVEPTDTDGDGSRNISTLAHLRWVSENSSCWKDNMELDNDIDAYETYSWNSYSGFSPIGNGSTQYTGIFDGNGYIIYDLTISRSASYIGLFGYTNRGCEIQNLGLEYCNMYGSTYTGGMVGAGYYSKFTNCHVSGSVYGTSSYVGGLIGYSYYSNSIDCYSEADVQGSSSMTGGLIGYGNYGSVNGCYATGYIYGVNYTGCLIGYSNYTNLYSSYATGDAEGSSDYTGCLAGQHYYGVVANCYATGSAYGTNYVGGLVGYCYGASVTNSYSTGYVYGSGGTNLGGLIGYNGSCTYTGCFWDTNTSGYTTSAGGTGKTTTQLKTKSTFTDAGWDFDMIWKISSGYPYIEVNMTGAPTDTDGDGSLNISTLDHFKWLSATGFYADKNWELDNDIDASDTKNWNAKTGWSPIPNYTGNFDGHNYKISNLYINRSTSDYMALFGIIGGTVKDLTLDKCYISGKQYVAGIAAKSDGNAAKGKVTNCFVTGEIRATGAYSGGLVGYNYYADINNSSSTANVYGSSQSGGLVGYNVYGNIGNSYSSGIVTCASSYAGGLVGYSNYGTISNSYATGAVSGRSSYVGGLVGYHNYTSTKNSYATGSVSNVSSYTGGFVGRNNYGTISNCYATGRVTNTSSYTGGFAGDAYGSTTVPATMTNCYSTGYVDASSVAGGFIGSQTYGVFNNCFWDMPTSNFTTSAGGTGKTTAQMKTKSTFTGWDFDMIWGITSGYPFISINFAAGPSDTDGDGSINIASLAHFKWLAETGYYTDIDWELDNDIDASDTKNWNSGAGFIPIVTYSNIFDGNGYAIKGLYIYRPATNYVAFIGTLKGTVKNHTIDAHYVNGSQYVGGITGKSDYGTIDNCTVNGDIYGASSYTGGIAAYNNYATIKNCKVTGSVNSTSSYVGGVTANNYYGNISYTSVNANVYGASNYTGGLVAYNYYGNIDFCSSAGYVQGVSYVGGLVGQHYYTTISNSFSTAQVYGSSNYVAGLSGYNYNATITNSYATGSVYGASYVGGLAGYFAGSPCYVTNCYSTGYVSGSSTLGGLIGYNSGGTYTSSYWDANTSGQSYSAGGTSKTTALMKTQSTFTNWNFKDLWAIDGKKNNGYPYIIVPLQAPVLRSPNNMAQDVALMPTFTWGQVTDATSYNLVVTDENNKVVININTPGTSYKSTISLTPGSRITWVVNATDGSRVSKWSETWAFITETIKAPTLTTPANLATGVVVIPTFAWGKVVSAISYHLDVATDAAFSNKIISTDLSGTTYTPSKKLLAFGTTYYYRANATDGIITSVWSKTNQFTTEALRYPTIIAPAAFATGVVVSPTFEWVGLVGASGYHLDVATDASFSTRLINTDVSGTSYTPPTKVLSFGTTYYWRINTADGMVSSTWSATRQFTTEPLLAPKLTAPAHLAEFVLTSTSLTWAKIVGSSDYIFQLAKDSKFTNIVTEQTLLTNSYTPASVLDLGTTYFWRVKARDGSIMSPWSEERQFRTEPIKVPVIAYPMNLATGINMFTPFNWSDVATVVSYHIEVATDMSFTNKVIDTYVGASEYTPIVPLVKETTYYWHVNANNGMENSLWTATYEFKIEPLEVPMLATPSNNLMDAVLRPVFDWNDIRDAARYTIQISTDDSFSSDVLETVVTTSNYTPTSDLLEATKYFWRVVATDDIVLSQWSEVRNFTTEPIVPPLLYTPANNAIDLVLLPSFDWNDVLGATKYHLQISTTANFSAIVVEKDLTASAYTATTELLEHTNYFWRVNATNGKDISRWSETRTFKTEPIVPPLLYTPANNAMDLVLLPSFDWNDVVEATGYRIQISTTANFSTIAIQADVTGSAYTATTELREHTNYFWRVNATNGKDVGRWSEVRNFTTEPIVPPLLYTPANNAVDVVFAPTFDWNDVVEATSYNIEISKTADFKTTVRDVDVSGSTYTTTGSLEESATYFWRVNATNGKDIGRWSETRTFLVSPIFPTNLVTPAANATNLTVNPTFTWTTVRYAVGYRIEVSKTTDFAVRAVEAYVFGTTYTPNVNLEENTTYYWRVYATNGTDISHWSEVRTLKTEAIAPPFTTTPAAMATNVSLTPTFNWIIVRSATSYNVEVSTDANFATKVIDADVKTTYYTPMTILKGETTYYWRASATNGTDISKWSAVKSFETKALDAPVLTTPAAMATSVDVMPTFNWAATTGATSYNLEVAMDMAFATKVIDKDVTTTSYTSTVVLDNYTTYYWRVNATDQSSVSPWSDARTFATSCEYAAPVDTDNDGYYNITNLCELRWVAEHTTLWASKFELDNNIDASSTQGWNNGAGFSPIGNATTAFTGEFNGNDNAIEGLYINRTTAINVGLFGVNAGTIKNTVVKNANITGDQYVGALAGKTTGSIITCATTGKVKGTYNVGGLAGENNNGTMETSFSNAVITGQKYTGGLVGNNYIATIKNSYATGAVTGTENVAGFAGGNYKATIQYAYATGRVTGTSVIGGLVGKNEQSTVTGAYWDKATTGIAAAGAGIGMTTTEMKTEAKFINWDFKFVWTINANNNGYPCFNISPVNNNVTHSIALAKGWNMTSTYVEAEDNDLENMTSKIISDVVLVKDQAGNIFYPEYNIDLINTWTVEKGYLFYMKKATTLDVEGPAVEEGRVVNLTAGWNMIAYLCDAPQPIKTALDDIKSNILLVKNGMGQIYFPSVNIDGIGNMNPGEGYLVYMNKNDAFEYPAPGLIPPKVTPTGGLQEIKFENPSCNNATVVIDLNMPNTTEVEAYGENNNLVGAAKVINGRVVLTVYGDDEYTEVADGAKANENITFKALNPNTAKWDVLELTDIKSIVSENAYNNVKYQTNSILQAKVANDIITLNTNTMTVMPNPANTNPQLSLNINTDNEITIEVFNAAGTLVQTVYNGKFINNTTINIDNMASGSYQVVVRTNDAVYTTTMVIAK